MAETLSKDLQLASHPDIAAANGPVVLLVLDGVGIGRGDDYDAVALAFTPNMDALAERCLTTSLKAHGTAVGMPSDADMGNSEVGHNALGAGRVFAQGAALVNEAIASGALWDGHWHQVIAGLSASGGALHLIGLLSDGNVHSHIDHLEAMLRRAAGEGIERACVHALIDGRDVPDGSALEYIDRLEAVLTELSAAEGRDYRIASGGGRMTTTMDRYNADWTIVERGWNAHVHGDARRFASAREAIETLRAEDPGVADQFLPAFVMAGPGDEPVGRIADGDAVVVFNFRGDRMIELSRAFEDGDDFDAFDRGRVPEVGFSAMLLYDGDLAIPTHYLVEPPAIERTMGEYLAEAGVTQYACAETQKFGHVTYFWNGNRSGKFDEALEEYVEIPSDRIHFERGPWMKSRETADAVIHAIQSGRHRFIRANFAGGDMVGHTGSLQAARIAVESLDLALGRIVPVVERAGGCLLVTADHGNCDDMAERDKQGEPLRGPDGAVKMRTAHSLNAVRLWILDAGARPLVLEGGIAEPGLANVAATTLALLGFAAPTDYEPSLITTA